MWLQLTNLFHRTSQPIGHIRERQALIQPVWRADLFPQRFHPLHSKRFRTWKEGWWLLTLALQALKRAPSWHADVPLGLLQLEFVRKRYHKDIPSSPVLMLNFCPNLLCEPLELHKATRELLFLVDRSGSMSGTKIHSVKVRCRQDKKHTNEPEFYRFKHVYWSGHVLFILSCFHRKPWWLHWRVSLLAPSSTLWASAPPSSLCLPPASSALMLALHNDFA